MNNETSKLTPAMAAPAITPIIKPDLIYAAVSVSSDILERKAPTLAPTAPPNINPTKMYLRFLTILST